MNQRSNTTIQDIAKAANVSKSTVSRVLNDSTPVAPQKREAVLEAMRRLQYQPNLVARSLAGGNSMTIGIVTQNIGSPFYDSVTQGVIQGVSESTYSPIFADGRWDPEWEAKAIDTLVNRNVDGMVIVGGSLSAAQLEEHCQGKPVVVCARRLEAMPDSCIGIDNVQAAHDAVRFLIESGHQRIAHICGIREHRDAQDRYEGYCRALADAQIPLDPELVVDGNFSSQSGVLAVETLLLRGVSFTAIFAANDEMAMGVRLALYRRGIRVPEEVSIVGFDNQPHSAFMTPPLTTVEQPANRMGQAAASLLLAKLCKEPYQPPELETRLIVRDSVRRWVRET